VRALAAALVLGFAGVAHASHCTTGNSSWTHSGGGAFVADYNDPKWFACVSSGAGRHESFESWVGAQYACEGTYEKPTGGSASLRILQCEKATATTGSCTWADAPPGTPSGHQDRVNVAHACINCNAGFHWTGEAACVLGNGDGCNYGQPDCETCGNPIHGATGNKYQREADYAGRGPFPLEFVRSYNSFIGFSRANLGLGWRSNYDRVLKVRPYGSFGEPPYQWVMPEVRITATRGDGRELTFTATVDAATNFALPDGTFLAAPPYARERLQKVTDGFRLYTAADEVEAYSASGKLQSVADRAGRTQVLSYRDDGRLEEVRDAFGRRMTFAYGAQGRLVQVTDPAGGTFQYSYDAAGRLTAVTYPDGATRGYRYENTNVPHLLTGLVDENGDRFATWVYGSLARAVISEHAGGAGRVALGFNADGTTTETDALGKVRRLAFSNISGLLRLAGAGVTCTGCASMSQAFTHDAAGNAQSRTDWNGNVTQYAHDARGLQTSRTEAHGTAQARTIGTQWHASLRLPTRIDEPGRVTSYAYDAAGNRLSETVADTATGDTRTTLWTYDALGQVLSVDGPRTDVSDVTRYAYHECTTGGRCGQVRTITNALGQVTTIDSYDAHGNPLAVVDANGVAMALAYDARQRLVSRTVAGATTRYDYDGVGQLVRVTQPDGSRVDYDYDAAHRLVGIADGLGNRIQYTLDAMGNRTGEQTFDPAGALKRAQSRVFNALGRLEAVRNAAGEVVTRYGYDNKGNRTSQLDYSAPATSHATAFVPDALDRVAQVTDAAGGITRYAYDARDQLVSVTDANGLVTRYTLNALGDLERQESPDSGVTTYTYDDAGNRKSQLDARGVAVGYSYDALNRLVRVAYPDADVTYSYDDVAQPHGVGRLTGIVDRSGTTTLAYDARGNVTEQRRVIGGRTYDTSHTYDEADRLASVTYPSGRTVAYARDALGQVSGVTAAGGSLASDIRHLPFGPVSGFMLGNGIAVARTHDADYRLAEYRDGAVQHLRLYYDLRGNVEATENVLDPARSQGFGYDALSRLTSAEGPYGIQDFSYDGVGNRLAHSANTYTYAAGSHRLSEVSDGTSFSYDDAGNVTAKEGLALTYGSDGRLRSVLRDGKRVGEYAYDASGQRAIKVTGDAGPDYLAMAEEAERQAQALRLQAQQLEALAEQYDQQAQELAGEAARFEEQASALSAQAGEARAEAAGHEQQALRDQASAAYWQQLADQARKAADSASGLSRWILLRWAQLCEVAAGYFQDSAEQYLALQQQALARAAELDQQAQALSVQAQSLRAEAQRLADLAQAARVEAQQQLAQAVELEQQALEYRRLAQEQEQNPPQVATHFVYDRAGALLGEYRDDGSVVREYAWLDGMPLALFAGADAAAYAIHSDHLDTPQKMTDAGGQVVWDASYEPFGQVTLLTEAVELPLRFPGQYFDGETGLHQNWHRDYDPGLGRYLQSDPIGLAGGLNTYAYVEGNPVKFVDPRGLDSAGCDGVPDWFENPCRLECCAKHDECFSENGCVSSSWYSECSKECDACNADVKKCFIDCGWSKTDDPSKPNYYCAKQKRYIKIPGDFPDYKTAKVACEATAPSPQKDSKGDEKARPSVPNPKEIFRGIP
jgi:RHS repeat-associated protein